MRLKRKFNYTDLTLLMISTSKTDGIKTLGFLFSFQHLPNKHRRNDNIKTKMKMKMNTALLLNYNCI